jgi:hypothetical protein
MNIAGVRSIGFAILLVLLAGANCNRPKRASSESNAAAVPMAVFSSPVSPILIPKTHLAFYPHAR